MAASLRLDEEYSAEEAARDHDNNQQTVSRLRIVHCTWQLYFCIDRKTTLTSDDNVLSQVIHFWYHLETDVYHTSFVHN